MKKNIIRFISVGLLFYMWTLILNVFFDAMAGDNLAVVSFALGLMTFLYLDEKTIFKILRLN